MIDPRHIIAALDRMASIRRDYPIDMMYDAGFLEAVAAMRNCIKAMAKLPTRKEAA